MSTLDSRFRLAFDPDRHTQAGLAKAARVSAASVSDWFSGETRTLKAEPMVRAAAYLDVLPHWLATGEGPMRAIHPANAGFAAEQTPPPYHNPPDTDARTDAERTLQHLAHMLAATDPAHLPAVGKLLDAMANARGDAGAVLPALLALLGPAAAPPSWRSVAMRCLVEEVRSPAVRQTVAGFVQAVDDAHALAVDDARRKAPRTSAHQAQSQHA